MNEEALQSTLAGILEECRGRVDLQDFALNPRAAGIEQVTGFFPDQFLALQTTRQGGVSEGPFGGFNLGDHVGDHAERVAANRARLVQHCTAQVAWLSQVHGTSVADLDAPGAFDAAGLFAEGRPYPADACVTALPGRACTVMTADCLPVLVARPSTGQCAAAHAGWRGLLNGVIESTLDHMARVRSPESADDWHIWLGPAIGEQAFEVGAEVQDAFIGRWPDASRAFVAAKNRPGKWWASLAGLGLQRVAAWSAAAKATGVRVRVAVSRECVFSDTARYFSYRRDGVTGRMASLIVRI